MPTKGEKAAAVTVLLFHQSFALLCLTRAVIVLSIFIVFFIMLGVVTQETFFRRTSHQQTRKTTACSIVSVCTTPDLCDASTVTTCYLTELNKG